MEPTRTRLLVVDDDRLVLAAFVSGLSRAGFDVLVASSAYEGIRLAVEAKPALALLDVRMEGRSGLDVAKVLKRETRVPFMFLASTGDDEAERQAADFGAIGHLLKPIDVRLAIPAIRAALERAATAARIREGAANLESLLAQGRGQQVLIALGILVERNKVNCDQALTLLQDGARNAGRTVEEEALRAIEEAEGAATNGRV